jgi:hypothetical protein
MQGLGIGTADGVELYALVRARLNLTDASDLREIETMIQEHNIKVVDAGPLSQIANIMDENNAAPAAPVPAQAPVPPPAPPAPLPHRRPQALHPLARASQSRPRRRRTVTPCSSDPGSGRRARPQLPGSPLMLCPSPPTGGAAAHRPGAATADCGAESRELNPVIPAVRSIVPSACSSTSRGSRPMRSPFLDAQPLTAEACRASP